MRGLQGKIALVTGAARGIGKATAARLIKEGATVVATDIAPETDTVLEHDVASEDSWSAIHAHVVERHGGLDVLVNNAGILREAPVEHTPTEMWDAIVDTNLKGTFFGCRQFVDLLARRGGVIINLSSIDGIRGSFRHVAYAATKGGIASMTRAMALELAERGIRVNALAPGTVDTPLVAQLIADQGDTQAARASRVAVHPLGRISTPEEQASAIAFLASEDARFITGVVLSVDGGRAIR